MAQVLPTGGLRLPLNRDHTDILHEAHLSLSPCPEPDRAGFAVQPSAFILQTFFGEPLVREPIEAGRVVCGILIHQGQKALRVEGFDRDGLP